MPLVIFTMLPLLPPPAAEQLSSSDSVACVRTTMPFGGGFGLQPPSDVSMVIVLYRTDGAAAVATVVDADADDEDDDAVGAQAVVVIL